jgi:hypothetical protein
MATKLYFHEAISTVSGTLPAAEQSSLTITESAEAQTVNRTMNITIGTSEANKAITVNVTGARVTYFTRFVSLPLNQTSIAANTWDYSFAAQQNSTALNFPTPSGAANQTVRIMCYVWRPSNGTKIGNILDGTSVANFGSLATTTKKATTGTFAGSAVTCAVGDIICFEVIFTYSTASGSKTGTYYYDGTAETLTDGTVVTSHATFINTPETIAFTGGANNITIAVPTQTVSVSESLTPTRNKIRTTATQTTTISETPTRLAAKNRALATQTTTVSEPSLVRVRNKPRAPTAETITVGAGTLARLATKIRALSTETVTKSETIARLKSRKVVLPTETITIGAGTLAKVKGKVKVLTESVTIAENLARLSAKIRALATQTTTVSGTLTRIKGSIKTLTESVIVGAGTLSRLTAKIRLLATQTVTITEANSRLTSKIRSIATQTVALSETINRVAAHAGINITRNLIETIIVSDSLVRRLTKIRAITENVTKSETIVRLAAKKRILATETITVGSGTLTRLKSVLRLSTESITISAGTLTRLISKIRTVTDTVSKGESLTRSLAKTRARTETINLSESLARRLAKIRTRTETIAISDLISIVASGAIRHIVRVIDDIDVIVSDFFYKARILPTEIIAISGLVDRLVTDNTPTNFVKTLTDSTTIGADNISRQASKLKSVNESTGQSDNLAITRRTKNRVNIESNIITDNVTFFKPQKNIVKGLSDSVSIDSGTITRQAGKVRRIGGPG